MKSTESHVCKWHVPVYATSILGHSIPTSILQVNELVAWVSNPANNDALPPSPLMCLQVICLLPPESLSPASADTSSISRVRKISDRFLFSFCTGFRAVVSAAWKGGKLSVKTLRQDTMRSLHPPNVLAGHIFTRSRITAACERRYEQRFQE